MRVPCFVCGEPYERKRYGRSTHYCVACRKRRRQARQRAWVREQRKLRKEIVESTLAKVPKGLEDEFRQRVRSLDLGDNGAIIGSLVLPAEASFPAVIDRQPAGTWSPAGSDDGMSTKHQDLAAELDELRRQAAEHPWWSEFPHTFIGLDG